MTRALDTGRILGAEVGEGLRAVLREPTALFFSVLMPVGFYALFTSIFGGGADPGTGLSYAATSLATYGTFGVVSVMLLNPGIGVAEDRTRGWLRVKMVSATPLGITLVGWVATCIIAALTTTRGGFWYAAAIAGVCMGSSQSSGRAMAGMLAPPAQLAEFFGLWTFATRVASIIGPLSYGAITWMTGGNQRLAIGFTAVLFLIGLALLMPVNVQRGRAAALGEGALSH